MRDCVCEHECVDVEERVVCLGLCVFECLYVKEAGLCVGCVCDCV